jgi:CheY-like chemotaxis protein
VDDDASLVRLFTQAIKSSAQADHKLNDIRFIPAYSGHDALYILKNQPVDAVLLDLDLPDIHGTQVLAEIKKDDRLKQVPIIIISASDISEDIQANQAVNLQVKIKHPFKQEDLAIILQNVLHQLRPRYQELKEDELIQDTQGLNSGK